MIITAVPPKVPTIYANAVNLLTTKTEAILDFAYVVESAEKAENAEKINTADQASEFTPEVRIILGVNSLRRLGQILLKAAQQQEQATASNPTHPKIAEEA